MALRFWVGGTGPWNGSSTANWAATSGGASGASVPTSSDTVTFDASSGGGTVTLGADGACSTLTLTNGTQTFSNAGGYKIVVSGTGAAFTNGASIVLSNPVTIEGNNSSASARTYDGGASTSPANAFDISIVGGSGAVTISNVWNNITYNSGFTGSMAGANRTIYGNLVLVAGMTFSATGTATTFGGTGGTKTITTAGVTIDSIVVFNGTSRTWQLTDNFVQGSARSFSLINGTFDANGKNVTVGSFALGAGTKTLTLGSGTWTCAGAWNANTNVSGLTVTASTGTISLTSGSAITFSGGAKTWPTLNLAGAGPFTIGQSNSFANITNTVQPTTLTVFQSTTQTLTNFSLSGTAGNLVTLQSSTAGTPATLSMASGTVTCSYLSIKDSTATGGANWYAYNSTSVSGNTGWNISTGPDPSTSTVATFQGAIRGVIQSFLISGRI